MLVSLTVGKVDAGVAVLLTEDKRLIEFPSILLPPQITSGSIVDITVARNLDAETESRDAFARLQNEIYSTFGQQSPAAPVLRCRNATQTSVVLEWDPLFLASADLHSLSLYRNGSKAGNIPRPMEIQSTKISGLAVDTPYTFHLVLKTSAGTYSSQKLSVKTHKMTDLSGITVTPGILPPQLKDSLQAAVDRIGAKMIDTVRIDTTHFVCTEGRGQPWERATEMNIPVVRPEWVEGCEREGRVVGVRGYYLNADPRLRQIGQGIGHQSQASQSSQMSQTQQPTAQPSQRTVPVREEPQQPQEQPAPQQQQQQQPPPPPATSTTEESATATQSTSREREDLSATSAPPPPPKDEKVEEKQEETPEEATEEIKTNGVAREPDPEPKEEPEPEIQKVATEDSKDENGNKESAETEALPIETPPAEEPSVSKTTEAPTPGPDEETTTKESNGEKEPEQRNSPEGFDEVDL